LILATSCFRPSPQLDWSLISSAATLSGFSAVLAAFMFAAMVLLLTREPREYAGGKVRSAIDPRIGRPIAFMFTAFFSLVMAAFLFAAMTGEEADKANPRQFIEGAMPALVLALGVMQMAVGLTWLIDVRDLAGVPIELARLIVHATVVLAGFLLTGVVVSPLLQSLVDLSFGMSPGIAWLILMGVIVAAIPLGLLGRKPLTRFLWHDQLIRTVNVSSIAMAVVAASAWAGLSSVSRCAVLPLYDSPGGNVVVLAAFGLVMLMLAALEAATPGRRRPLHGLR